MRTDRGYVSTSAATGLHLDLCLLALRPDEPASTAGQCDFRKGLRAIGRAWGWRRRMDAGEFATIQELANILKIVERFVTR